MKTEQIQPTPEAGQTGTPTAHESTPLPWRAYFNPGGPGNQPAFPFVEDSSDRPDGESIICMPLGFSEIVKQNCAFIVHCVNTHAALTSRVAQLEAALTNILATERSVISVMIGGMIPGWQNVQNEYAVIRAALQTP